MSENGQVVKIELFSSQARGRNGDFNADELVLSIERGEEGESQLVIEAFSKRRKDTDQAPTRVALPTSLGAEATLRLVDMLRLKGRFSKPATSAEMACEGLDPRALERLGRGGLTQILQALDTYTKNGKDLESYPDTIKTILRKIVPLVPEEVENEVE
jgi:hypothetical protein